MTRIFASIVSILVLLVGFDLHTGCRAADYGDAGVGPAPGWYETAEATDQGWDYDTAQWWYHVDQGTAFIPYEWFLALEQARGEELFRAPGNMERLGFFPNPPNNFNPDGIPVGFSRTKLNLDKGPYQCWQGNWLGLTCAACHTGQVNFHGTRIRIEAGPAQNDIETFREELSNAVAATAASPSKARRFGMRVAAAMGQPDPSLEQKLLCYLGAGRQRALVEEQGLAAADEVPTPSGFGRLKADTDRRDKVLFIDARQIYHQIDRAHRDFTPKQIEFIANIARMYRGEEPELIQGSFELLKEKGLAKGYVDLPGLCKVATIEKVEAQGWSLNPGRYVDVADRAPEDFDFAERLEELSEELEQLNLEAKELQERIAVKVADVLEIAQ